MNIQTCKAQFLTSPFGENIITSSFQMMLPNPGEDYTPVLLHCDMKNLGDEVYGVLKDIYTKDTPPIILLTYDHNPKDDAIILDYIQNNELADLFDAVISIHNDDMGFQDGYGTLFNNLPLALEEKLDSLLEWGKFVNEGNKTAEALGAILNKPVISMNLLGKQDDVKNLEAIMECIEPYPDYNYSKSITKFNPKKDDKSICACCGKRRSPLKFFYKIQGHLCQACESKIKQKGEVNILNWYKVGLELKKEREQTRKSNIKQNIRALSLSCPVCGSELRPRGYHRFFCPHCKEMMWVKGKNTYRMTRVMNRDQILQYNERGKQIDSFFLSDNRRSEVKYCEICRNPSPDYVYVKTQDHSPAIVCKECLDSAPGGIMQIKKILEGGDYHA